MQPDEHAMIDQIAKVERQLEVMLSAIENAPGTNPFDFAMATKELRFGLNHLKRSVGSKHSGDDIPNFLKRQAE